MSLHPLKDRLYPKTYWIAYLDSIFEYHWIFKCCLGRQHNIFFLEKLLFIKQMSVNLTCKLIQNLVQNSKKHLQLILLCNLMIFHVQKDIQEEWLVGETWFDPGID